MKRLFLIAMCLILLIGLSMAFLPSLHPGASTQGDMQVAMTAAQPEPLIIGSALFARSAELEQNATNSIFGLCGAILLTAMAVTVVARKRLCLWMIFSARTLYASLKARVYGALAAGDQLKYPFAARC
jgi:hypothetical protein